MHCAGVHTNDSLQTVARTTGTGTSIDSNGDGDGDGGGANSMLRTMQVNVVAPAVLTSALLPSMVHGSSVVYIGSTLSEIGVAGRLSYVASKHAVIGLTR